MQNLLHSLYCNNNILAAKDISNFGMENNDINSVEVTITTADPLITSLIAREVANTDKWKQNQTSSNILRLKTSNAFLIYSILTNILAKYIERLDDKKVVIRRDDAFGNKVGVIFNRCLVSPLINKLCQRVGLSVDPFKLEVTFSFTIKGVLAQEAILRSFQIPVKMIQ
jgi:hypothetical protein